MFANDVVVVVGTAVAILSFTFEIVDDIDELFVDHAPQFAVDRGESEALAVTDGLGVQLLGTHETRHRGECGQDGRSRLTRHGP